MGAATKKRRLRLIKKFLYLIHITQMTNAKDNKTLKEAFMNIEKQFGKGAVMRMGDHANFGLVNTFHSGSYVLDLIL